MFRVPDYLQFRLPHTTFLAVLDILLVAFFIYQFLVIIRGRRAAHIVLGLAIIASIYGLSIILGLELLRSLLAMLAPYAPFALIVMFQSEIRRMLARIGRRRLLSIGGRLQKREFADELVLALGHLASQKTGALIVIERDIGLRTFIESGVVLEAFLSRDLLLTIFQNGSALHDGAVIVQGERIAAAACFLPLSVKPMFTGKLGTRHRAGIGVTEEADCLSLIVSEETGHISVAAFGEIERNVMPDRLQERITEHLIQKRWSPNYRGLLTDERFEGNPAHDAHID